MLAVEGSEERAMPFRRRPQTLLKSC